MFSFFISTVLLDLFGLEKNHHMEFSCIHIFLFDYLKCEFGAIILCVDFGASGDCDCEDCCYFPNYQGKKYFMYLSHYFDYALVVFVGFRSMENKKFLPHTKKQAKIYLLDCSNESME